MSIVLGTNRSTWSKGRVRYIITELRVHKCLELKSKLFPPDFTGMPPSNNTQTYTQVFLGANKEQLNSSGVVLPQGVFKPLSAERTRPDQVPQLGVKTCSEICSSWTSSPHVAQRGDVVYVERYNHDWKEDNVLNELTVSNAQVLVVLRIHGFLCVHGQRRALTSAEKSLTLGSSVVRGSDALEPLLACSVPAVKQGRTF